MSGAFDHVYIIKIILIYALLLTYQNTSIYVKFCNMSCKFVSIDILEFIAIYNVFSSIYIQFTYRPYVYIYIYHFIRYIKIYGNLSKII